MSVTVIPTLSEITSMPIPKLRDALGPHSNIPAGYAAVVVPDTPFASTSRGIYVGVGGDIAAVMAGDNAIVIFTAVPSGSIIPIRATEVKITGTTATNMVVLW